MEPLSLQADNSNRRMKEDKVQRALQQWIRSGKISFILQIELAIVSIDFMSEKSAQIQSRKVHWSSIVSDTYLTRYSIKVLVSNSIAPPYTAGTNLLGRFLIFFLEWVRLQMENGAVKKYPFLLSSKPLNR